MEDFLTFLCKIVATLSSASFEQLEPPQVYDSRPSSRGGTCDQDAGYFVTWVLSGENDEEKNSRVGTLGYVLHRNQWFRPGGNAGTAALVWMMALHCSAPLTTLQDQLRQLQGLITMEECHQYHQRWVLERLLPGVFAGASATVLDTFRHCLKEGSTLSTSSSNPGSIEPCDEGNQIAVVGSYDTGNGPPVLEDDQLDPTSAMVTQAVSAVVNGPVNHGQRERVTVLHDSTCYESDHYDGISSQEEEIPSSIADKDLPELTNSTQDVQTTELNSSVTLVAPRSVVANENSGVSIARLQHVRVQPAAMGRSMSKRLKRVQQSRLA